CATQAPISPASSGGEQPTRAAISCKSRRAVESSCSHINSTPRGSTPAAVAAAVHTASPWVWRAKYSIERLTRPCIRFPLLPRLYGPQTLRCGESVRESAGQRLAHLRDLERRPARFRGKAGQALVAGADEIDQRGGERRRWIGGQPPQIARQQPAFGDQRADQIGVAQQVVEDRLRQQVKGF